MARNTTRQGAGFELDVMHYLMGCSCETTYAQPRHIGWRGFGYDAGRSSGSRGKVDVWGVPPEPGFDLDEEQPWGVKIPAMIFVQCKITNPVIPPAERIALINLARRGGALPIVAHRAVDKNTRRIRPHFRQLTGPGPKDWLPWEPERTT